MGAGRRRLRAVQHGRTAELDPVSVCLVQVRVVPVRRTPPTDHSRAPAATTPAAATSCSPTAACTSSSRRSPSRRTGRWGPRPTARSSRPTATELSRARPSRRWIRKRPSEGPFSALSDEAVHSLRLNLARLHDFRARTQIRLQRSVMPLGFANCSGSNLLKSAFRMTSRCSSGGTASARLEGVCVPRSP